MIVQDTVARVEVTFVWQPRYIFLWQRWVGCTQQTVDELGKRCTAGGVPQLFVVGHGEG